MSRETLIISFLVLAGAAIWASAENKDGSSHLIRLAIVITAAYAVLGFIGVCTDGRRGSDALDQLEDCSTVLLPLVVLPCAVTEVWLKNPMFHPELAYAHTVAGIAFAFLFILGCVGDDLINVLVVISVVSLIVPGAMKPDYGVILAGACFFGAHFGVPYLKKNTSTQIPFDDFYNYCMVGFGYFAIQSVNP